MVPGCDPRVMASRDETPPHNDAEDRFEVTGRPTERDRSRPKTATDARRVRTGAKALLVGSDQALLVQERHADGSTFWTLPGGGLRAQERPADGLRRELAEELDCRVLVGDPVASVWYHHRHSPAVTCYEVFDCSLLSEPSAERQEGIIGYRWVPLESPPVSTLPQIRSLLRSRGQR